MNDYEVKDYRYTSSFKQDWLDPPGDCPKDIRARRFAAKLSPHLSKQEKDTLQMMKQPIYRSTYICAQACCRDLAQERQIEHQDRHRVDHGGYIHSA